ncbi:hypothetical protein [Embleya sp. AB8]|uniref:hypothetical protein n=1 Tax=Embleya sp. AB8 TaxID=3156304 RepID=UPI003C771577
MTEFPYDVGDFVFVFHSDGDQIGAGFVVAVDTSGGRVTVDMRNGWRASLPLSLVGPAPARPPAGPGSDEGDSDSDGDGGSRDLWQEILAAQQAWRVRALPDGALARWQ